MVSVHVGLRTSSKYSGAVEVDIWIPSLPSSQNTSLRGGLQHSSKSLNLEEEISSFSKPISLSSCSTLDLTSSRFSIRIQDDLTGPASTRAESFGVRATKNDDLDLTKSRDSHDGDKLPSSICPKPSLIHMKRTFGVVHGMNALNVLPIESFRSDIKEILVLEDYEETLHYTLDANRWIIPSSPLNILPLVGMQEITSSVRCGARERLRLKSISHVRVNVPVPCG